MLTTKLLGAAAATLLSLAGLTHAQVIGSYDNFDCFNDTGETAEGFEIDVEDITVSDLTREFPSNFSSTPWVIRYGLPVVTSYNWIAAAPDAAHAYDAGHKGVLITWAASWNGSHWIAKYGNQPFGAATAGNGTPYVKAPTFTNGDSCWYYGLGNAYPSSGCDHFGISFVPNITPGRISYHWKIPNPAKPGSLKNAALEASIPPSPVLSTPVNPEDVHAVAQAPENHDPAIDPDKEWGDAYWVRITTLFGNQAAQLDGLQKANVQNNKAHKTVAWALLQRAPLKNENEQEKEDAEDHHLAGPQVQVTKQYEYFKYKGAYDRNHAALCGVVAVGLSKDCTQPYTKPYTAKDHGTSISAPAGDQGSYLGAHINAYNIH